MAMWIYGRSVIWCGLLAVQMVAGAGTMEECDTDPPEEPDVDCATPPSVSQPAQTPVTLTTTYFRGDATTTHGVSAWATESYPPALPSNARSTVFWGRFGSGGCATPGYGSTVEHPLSVCGTAVFRAAYPECEGAYGPSVEADVYAFDAPQHLLRTEVSPDGAFQDFGASGQNASGANAYIHGAYVNFSPSWNSSFTNRMRPWGGSSADPASIRLAVRAEQSVIDDTMEDPSAQQLQQVIRVLVINEACEIASSSSFCQLEYNFKTYIRGVNAYTTFEAGDVFNDEGQGGLIAVVGPINGTGQATTIQGDNAWVSWGSSTQQAPYDDTLFQVEISWDQFQVLLLNVTGGNPTPVFGPQWNDRHSWVLLAAGYGQENYNRSATKASSIEGMFESMELIAL